MLKFIIIFTLFVLSSSRIATDVPVVIWSGESYIYGQNIGITVPLVFNDIDSTLQSFFLSGSGKIKNYLSPTIHPEVVVLFLEPELRSEHLSLYSSSFGNLQNLLKNEKSSIFAPFVDLEDFSLDSTILRMIGTTVSNEGTVFYVGDSLPPFAQKGASSRSFAKINEFKEYITKNTQIFTNSKTDLVIVYFQSGATQEKFQESDLAINLVHTIISSSTTKYLDLYTALSYADPHLKMDFSTPLLKRSMNDLGNDSIPQPSPVPMPSNQTTNQTIPIFRQYFGGWFWELVIVCSVLIPLLVISVFGIDSIQTPIFESKKKAK